MKPYYDSILDTIGETPVVRLHHIEEIYQLEGKLLAKLEYFNPGASKKDRIAYEMIRQAEESGELKPGQTVVELTSGNTGTGLAIVCAATGHPFVACMSAGNSKERVQMMRALGATVVLVPQHEGATPGKVTGEDLLLTEERTQALVEELGAFRANQFALPSAVDAHRKTTAKEIWAQTEGAVDAFVDYVGTGSGYTGTMLGLRDENPAIRGYVVEPDTAPFYGSFPKKDGEHQIQGGGYGLELTLMDTSLITDVVEVNSTEARDAARLLAQTEGIFGGYSSGANVAAAVKLMQDREKGSVVVIPIGDSGLKYLSTDLFADDDSQA